MARFRYDRSSKWLLQHHGDSLLRLAGWTDIASWRAVQTEIVQPRQLPDGLIESRRAAGGEPDLFVVEVATYPDNRVPEQLLRDAALVYLDRGRLPEVVSIVLHPKGNVNVADRIELRSAGGLTTWQASWRVVELWTVPAEQLLAAGDVGLIPWVPLARIDGPPGPVIEQCREAIERDARPEERESLLVVTSVFTGLRYNDKTLVNLLRGRDAMFGIDITESWTVKWAMAERSYKLIAAALRRRFGAVPDDLHDLMKDVYDEERQEAAAAIAASCTDLDAFRREFAALPPPPPPETW